MAGVRTAGAVCGTDRPDLTVSARLVSPIAEVTYISHRGVWGMSRSTARLMRLALNFAECFYVLRRDQGARDPVGVKSAPIQRPR